MTTYNGTISQTIFKNQTVSGGNIKDLDFLNAPITWTTSSNLPNTLNQLLDNHQVSTVKYTIQIIGKQQYDNNSIPSTDVLLTFDSNRIGGGSFQANVTGASGTGIYNVNKLLVDYSAYVNNSDGLIANQIEINVYNKCSEGTTGCISYPATNYTLIVTLYINAQDKSQSTDVMFNSNEQSMNHIIVHHVMYN